ncbi:MAG: helix-turn-helix domain-containing protein [Desulfurococcales archaeon]|nr:helix-turn-helix domain-containing protein [Desulfurococcales archaeon]
MAYKHKIRLIKMDVVQRNCPLADSSREHGLYIEIVSAALQGNLSLLLVWASGANVKRLIRNIRYSRVVKRHHVLFNGDKSVWLYMVKESSGILRTIHESGGLLSSSIVISGGVKRFIVIIPSSNIRLLKARARENLESRGLRVLIEDVTEKFTESPQLLSGIFIPYSFVKIDLLNRLTPIEKKILLNILENGYYKWPRKSKVEELAKKHRISKSTMSYHIRNAERKILETLIRKYSLLDENVYRSG